MSMFLPISIFGRYWEHFAHNQIQCASLGSHKCGMKKHKGRGLLPCRPSLPARINRFKVTLSSTKIRSPCDFYFLRVSFDFFLHNITLNSIDDNIGCLESFYHSRPTLKFGGFWDWYVNSILHCVISIMNGHELLMIWDLDPAPYFPLMCSVMHCRMQVRAEGVQRDVRKTYIQSADCIQSAYCFQSAYWYYAPSVALSYSRAWARPPYISRVRLQPKGAPKKYLLLTYK